MILCAFYYKLIQIICKITVKYGVCKLQKNINFVTNTLKFGKIQKWGEELLIYNDTLTAKQNKEEILSLLQNNKSAIITMINID